MSTHTPGPWRITRDYPMMLGRGIAIQRGPEIAFQEETGQVLGLYLGREYELPMADLRLIAAAPELYELARGVSDLSILVSDFDVERRLIETARALVKRINGEQP